MGLREGSDSEGLRSRVERAQSLMRSADARRVHALAYRIHHLEEFGWAIDMTREGVPVWRMTGYATRAEAARELVVILAPADA